MTLDQEFKDLVIEAAYYNSKTGESVDVNNLVLNANIGKLKLIQLNKIKAYLDSVGVKYKDGFYEVQQAFYRHIKTLPDYKKILISQHAAKI